MICYHGTPLSGEILNVVRALANRDAMVSFYRPDQIKTIAEVCRSFVLDNGAFSAWRKGEPIEDWSKFYDWVEKWMKHPGAEWCCIPDSIEGDEGENDRLLDEWPFGEFGVPVFHLHESLERLGRLCDNYFRVAIGSSGSFAQVGTTKWWDRMGEILNYMCDAEGRPCVKMHGLRMLDPTLLAHIPFSSADSTHLARNICRDTKWRGPYAPSSPVARAAIIMDRLENHAKASRWSGTGGNQLNFELLDCSIPQDVSG